MLSLATILFIGFLLGMRHATDPDHVVAVTTIVARQPGVRRAGLIGALWGIGHTCTIFVVGAMIILFGVTIPPRLGLSMEFAVAAMLILLGILNLTGTLRQLQERFLMKSMALSQAGSSQSHWPGAGLRGMGAFTVFRPLLVGLVHGLAGSAAVALLVMSTIHDSWWAVAYLLLFGVGTVAGMVVITTLIAMPFTLTGSKFSRLNQGMGIASGLISVGFGLFLSFQIGIVDGLFTGHANWIPK
jgi:high-affinity nickel permease